MDFKEATDSLFDGVDHRTLADALGVSVASIRQARLRPDAKAHREPPRDWAYAVIRLAEREIMEKRRLIEKVKQQIGDKQ